MTSPDRPTPSRVGRFCVWGLLTSLRRQGDVYLLDKGAPMQASLIAAKSAEEVIEALANAVAVEPPAQPTKRRYLRSSELASHMPSRMVVIQPF